MVAAKTACPKLALRGKPRQAAARSIFISGDIKKLQLASSIAKASLNLAYEKLTHAA